ncbi:hypothetical protein LW14_26940, partial [Rhizobium sp. H41]
VEGSNPFARSSFSMCHDLSGVYFFRSGGFRFGVIGFILSVCERYKNCPPGGTYIEDGRLNAEAPNLSSL